MNRAIILMPLINLFVFFIVNAQETIAYSDINSQVFYYEHTNNLIDNSSLVNVNEVSTSIDFEIDDLLLSITKYDLHSVFWNKSEVIECDVNFMSPLKSINGCTNCSGCIQNGSSGSGEPACYKWTCTDEEFGFCAPIASNCCVGVILN